ncbi:MAG TPA: glycine betaine ABC transporter substrate-binding protein, partial [Devosiaceae bacterium]|nr:glycine betaine ABC transporter substrate-binding protein [Devosiaceae bacterium]
MTGRTRNLAWSAAIVGAAVFGTPALAQTECGTDRKIDIAEMTWASASVIAHIHAIILGEGYSCNVELVPGATVPTSASMMGNGEPAVTPELWMSSIADRWAEAEAAGTVVSLG